jgi:hypothetical protein
MTAKEKLIQEIEKAPESLVEEVLNFLLFTKARHTLKTSESLSKASVEAELQAMANDLEIQAELAAINEEFQLTEMDGLS